MTTEEKAARIKELQTCRLSERRRNPISDPAAEVEELAEWEWWMKTRVSIRQHRQTLPEMSAAARARIGNVIEGILDDLQQKTRSPV